MALPRIYTRENAVMLDRALEQVQQVLADNFDWLDHIFGQSQKLRSNPLSSSSRSKEVRADKSLIYPGFYTDKGEYINLLPSEDYGNYSFFTVEDPEGIDFYKHSSNYHKSNFRLIFWLNLEKVQENTNRNKEQLKLDIIQVLTHMTPNYGSFTFDTIFEESVNIFKGFDLKEVDSQYLMQPYYGFALKGEAKYIEDPCYVPPTPPTPPTPSGGCNNMPRVTGQTASFGPHDDGDLRIGRLEDFFTLEENNSNYFNSFHRFTGITGGYRDQTTGEWKDVNGNIVPDRITAFPEDIMLDWAYRDTETGAVMGWYMNDNSFNIDWDSALAWCYNFSTPSFNSLWHMPNEQELLSIKPGKAFATTPLYTFNFYPLLLDIAYTYWTATTPVSSPLAIRNTNFTTVTVNKTTTALMRCIPCRIFNESEL